MDNAILADLIDQHGFFIGLIDGTDYLPAYAMTIGLWQQYGHPELICFGQSTPTMEAIIRHAVSEIQNGFVIVTDQDNTTLYSPQRTIFLPVDPRSLGDYFGAAIDYYQSRDFKAIQMVWTDANGYFPWEDGFDEQLTYLQPLLDRNAEFKYMEPKDLPVFTTRQWIELGHPILTVVHDPDGDWQFLTNDETDEDARVVALHTIITKDPTVNDAFDLDYAEMATRDHIGGDWMRAPFAFDEEE